MKDASRDDLHRPSHDVLMKELISKLLEHFMKAFFPELYSFIDWGCTGQGNAEFPAGGTMKRPDLVFNSVIVGEPGKIFIHIESQAQRQQHFPYRMLLYTAVMAREGRRVLPIAICTYPNSKVTNPHADSDTIEMAFPSGPVLWFHFHRLDLKATNWRAYMNHVDNPAVVALLSRMEYTDGEKPALMRAFARGIMGLDENGRGSDASADMIALVSTYFHSYFELSREEERKVLDEILADAPQEGIAYMNNIDRYKAEGRQEGMQIGLQQGLQQGEQKGEQKGLLVSRQLLMEYLSMRFGNVPASVVAWLEMVQDLDSLKELSRAVYRASNMSEVEHILSAPEMAIPPVEEDAH